MGVAESLAISNTLVKDLSPSQACANVFLDSVLALNIVGMPKDVAPDRMISYLPWPPGLFIDHLQPIL